ncbi:hypothetical protein EQG41_07795 [Billgrantia azerbaijanica]|nr:hypothetical protein EQG41_07795 [Halomonas azerbaijanica]
MHTIRVMAASALASVLLTGCVVHGGGHGVWGYPDDDYEHEYEGGIPPGHLPPPGECRIWYPDRPPGHQPPPGACRDLQYRVPPGARLIRG